MISVLHAVIESRTAMAPERLAHFPLFRSFTPADLSLLAAAMQRLDLDAGTLLFSEGDPGGTCSEQPICDRVTAVNLKHRRRSPRPPRQLPGDSERSRKYCARRPNPSRTASSWAE